MNKDIVRIVSVITVGSIIGGVVARLVNPSIWFVGCIIGSLIAYLSFRWGDVEVAVKNAVKEAVTVRNPGYFRLELVRGWSNTIGALSLCATVYFHLLTLVLIISLCYPAFKPMIHVVGGAILVSLLMFVVIGSLKSFSGALDAMSDKDPESRWKICRCILQNYRIAKECFIPNALRREFQCMVWLVVHMPNACRAIGRFVCAVFITIHSETRLICGIDTAIGVAAGYWLSHSAVFTFVGAIIGVVIGLLHYNLVAIRWLKLKPV